MGETRERIRIESKKGGGMDYWRREEEELEVRREEREREPRRERALRPTFLEGDLVIISSSIIVDGSIARSARRGRGWSLLCLWWWDLWSSCNRKKQTKINH